MRESIHEKIFKKTDWIKGKDGKYRKQEDFIISEDLDPKLVQKAIRQSIFRKTEGKDEEEKTYNKRKRFYIIHKKLKSTIIYPILKFITMRFDKYLVKHLDDIPEEWHNNFIRIYYYSFHKGLFDMWTHMHREMNPRLKKKYQNIPNYLDKRPGCFAVNEYGSEDFDKYEKGHVDRRYAVGHWARKTLVNLWITEVMEDSIDREWFNFSVMNIVHETMKLYGVPKEHRDKVPWPGSDKFPVFKSGKEFNPEFHLRGIGHPVWKPDYEGTKDYRPPTDEERKEQKVPLGTNNANAKRRMYETFDTKGRIEKWLRESKLGKLKTKLKQWFQVKKN